MAVNLKIVSQVVASGTPGPAGKSAYQIAVDKGFKGTESEWLKELHPFKGWFDSVSELEEKHSSPSVGEYAYVKGATSSDPVKIYECSTEGSWSDSGRTVDTSTVQTFRSGEAVNDVGIDSEPTAGSDNLVKSGGVVVGINNNPQTKLYINSEAANVSSRVILGVPNYILVEGGAFKIKFENALSSTSNATLSINYITAKPLYYNGAIAKKSNSWNDGDIVNVFYDGTNYQSWSIDRDSDIKSNSSKSVPNSVIFDKTYRFLSQDYQCFRRYKQSSTDNELTTVNGKPVKQSDYYKAFLSLKLIKGFDRTKPHKLGYFMRNYQNGYSIIILAYNGSAWERVFNKSLTNVEASNPGGINRWHFKDTSYEVDAWIDYSFIPDNSYRWLETESADPNYIIKEECFIDNSEMDSLNERVTALENTDFLDESDLTIEIVSDNIANPANIEDGKAILNDGKIYARENWSIIKVPVQADQVITFGGFSLGAAAYYALYDGTTKISNQSISDATLPKTVTIPSDCNLLYIDIKTPSSSSAGYSNLMINYGTSLKTRDEYKEAITKIGGHELAGGNSTETEQEIQELDNRITAIENYAPQVIMDLPVSDGTEISVGYAYIDSTTGIVKIKMS